MYPYVHEVRKTVEGWTTPPRDPLFKIGDYVEVYNGRYEGHNFTVKKLRWNINRGEFEYEYWDTWYGESSIVKA